MARNSSAAKAQLQIDKVSGEPVLLYPEGVVLLNDPSAAIDSIQISFQADQADQADLLAGRPARVRKLAAAKLVKEANLPLTVNVVLHRANIERVEQIIAMAEQLGAQRLELANTQYLGWAFLMYMRVNLT